VISSIDINTDNTISLLQFRVEQAAHQDGGVLGRRQTVRQHHREQPGVNVIKLFFFITGDKA
jgi:hypothetical protein